MDFERVLKDLLERFDQSKVRYAVIGGFALGALGARLMRVLRPEDIVGLKVQAMVNDPKRRAKETADIEALVAANLESLDWDIIREFYELFDQKAQFQALKGSLDA